MLTVASIIREWNKNIPLASAMALATAAQPSKPKTKASRRLFVAVELPDRAKELCLDTVSEKLLPLDTDESSETTKTVKWVLDPSLFHCTLQFLGSVHEDRIHDLSDQLREQVKTVEPFTLQLGGLGCFPNAKSTKNARVIWLGLEGAIQELRDLSSGVMDATEPLGFRRERRAFNAHITLGRVRDSSGSGGIAPGRRRKRGWNNLQSAPLPPALQERIEQMMQPNEVLFEKQCWFPVNHVVLMESQMSKDGPQYVTLERFDLAGGGNRNDSPT